VRKLAAILCADVYGYSRLMGEDEEATLRTLTSHRKLIDSAIDQHHGRFVNSAGDSVLAEFASEALSSRSSCNSTMRLGKMSPHRVSSCTRPESSWFRPALPRLYRAPATPTRQ
jgi:class 3 adenylate cyclase